MATPMEQLEAMRRLSENWDGYGGAPPRSEVINLAQDFIGLIEGVRRLSEQHGKPGHVSAGRLHVSPTRIGGVLIEWDDRLMEHEVEINPDGSIGFLHLNKTTREIETRKLSAGGSAVVLPGLLQELKHLLAA